MAAAYVPGTVRYEVLKRAKFRCELCGISAEEKALEVDHIIPRKKKGKSDISNYQALCYTCNAQKRDLDKTDFRNMDEEYNFRSRDCPFCDPCGRIIEENYLAYGIYDKYPVTKKHILVIPKRHVHTYFGLYQPEINSLNQLLNSFRTHIQSDDPTVTSFNIGINNGKEAGQTIQHCHIHLIPRRKGDISNPCGGVRGVIPEKRIY